MYGWKDTRSAHALIVISVTPFHSIRLLAITHLSFSCQFESLYFSFPLLSFSFSFSSISSFSFESGSKFIESLDEGGLKDYQSCEDAISNYRAIYDQEV